MDSAAGHFEIWSNQLRKGVLELCVLNDIRKRKMYGYEIMKTFAKANGVFFGDGTIYRILKKLSRRGLVKTFVMQSPDGPPRKHYKLTKKGEDAVRRMNAYWRAISSTTDSIKKGRKARRV
jgi:PadR family transcriptional regulator PadR